jgi:hypothetical protein
MANRALAGCLVRFVVCESGITPEIKELVVSVKLDSEWKGISFVNMAFNFGFIFTLKSLMFTKTRTTLSFDTKSTHECEFVTGAITVGDFQRTLLNREVTLDLMAVLDKRPMLRSEKDSLATSLASRLKLDNDHLSDIDVVAGDRVFHCHKLILASRSDVFAAMFSHGNVKECQEGKVVLDEDSNVAELFLKFLYSDQIDGSLDEDNAVQMLMMADRYNVTKMKKTCSTFLAKKITVENVASILITGRRGNCSKLENIACSFIAKNVASVKKTEAWKKMVEDHHEFSILATLAEHM